MAESNARTSAATSAGERDLIQHAIGSAPASEHDLCQAGWTESLDRLAAYLAPA